MVVVVVAWVAATPLTLARPRLVQRVGDALIGPLQRLFEHVDARPGQYSEQDVSSYFWLNGAFPLVRPEPEAGWVVFYSLGDGPEGGLYYDAHPIEQMRNPLAMLAYDR
jgi:hypothetical protein